MASGLFISIVSLTSDDVVLLYSTCMLSEIINLALAHDMPHIK